MPWIFRLLADLTVILHLSYVGFVLIGQLLILCGWYFHWPWVRRWSFRGPHLSAILIVVLESWLGIVCPLTTLEQWLRKQAGQATHQGDFLGQFAHDLLFVDWEPWVFTIVYSSFGGLVLLTLWAVPPKRK